MQQLCFHRNEELRWYLSPVCPQSPLRFQTGKLPQA